MPDEPFNPRRAALNHAGLAERASLDLHLAAAAEDEERVISAVVRAYSDGVHAIACGLVYVGDQIGAQSEVVDAEVVDQAKVDYADALRRIAEHEEHMGSGPADDEMRQIAINALRGPV